MELVERRELEENLDILTDCNIEDEKVLSKIREED